MLGKTGPESKGVPCQSFSWLNRKPRRKIKAAVCSLSLHIGIIFSIAAAKSSFDAALEGVHRAEPAMRPHCIPWLSGKGRPSKKKTYSLTFLLVSVLVAAQVALQTAQLFVFVGLWPERQQAL